LPKGNQEIDLKAVGISGLGEQLLRLRRVMIVLGTELAAVAVLVRSDARPWDRHCH
jgi:hypothetical protein